MSDIGKRAAVKMMGDINDAYGEMMTTLKGDPGAQAFAIGMVLRHLVDAKGDKPFVEVARP